MALEYAVPTVPAGSVALMVNVEGAAAATTIERVADLVCAGLDESVTVTVKLAVPLAVGVPEIRPVEAMVSPAGKAPPVIDHE